MAGLGWQELVIVAVLIAPFVGAAVGVYALVRAVRARRRTRGTGAGTRFDGGNADAGAP